MWELSLGQYDLYFILYNLLIYSFLGWIYESTFVSIKSKTVINRGFLNGPLIPIYGFGATLVYLLLAPFKSRYLLIFVLSIVIATVLEFLTSYLLEKIFHAIWWDYSKFKYNIQGRVCVAVSLFWGGLSLIMLYGMQPIITNIIDGIPRNYGEKIGYIFIFGIIADLILTVVSTIHMDKMLSGMQKLREELSQYLEGTRLYGTKEEVLSKISNLKIGDMAQSFKSIIDDYMDRFDKKTDKKEGVNPAVSVDDMESRFKSFLLKYQLIINTTKLINKRILKAFPNFKSIDHEYPLKDVKDKMFKNRKNK